MNISPTLPPNWESWEDPMRLALKQAQKAETRGDVPVGAVLLSAEGEVLARSCNSPIFAHDPTAHAEILALREGGRKSRNYRLEGTILVATLEPCLMCLGALVHARVAGVVFGAPDPKTGALLSRLDGVNLDFLNHRFWVQGNVLTEECGDMLRNFFQARRKKNS
jgi:tRNA(adenine34) deaminase